MHFDEDGAEVDASEENDDQGFLADAGSQLACTPLLEIKTGPPVQIIDDDDTADEDDTGKTKKGEEKEEEGDVAEEEAEEGVEGEDDETEKKKEKKGKKMKEKKSKSSGITQKEGKRNKEQRKWVAQSKEAALHAKTAEELQLEARQRDDEADAMKPGEPMASGDAEGEDEEEEEGTGRQRKSKKEFSEVVKDYEECLSLFFVRVHPTLSSCCSTFCRLADQASPTRTHARQLGHHQDRLRCLPGPS